MWPLLLLLGLAQSCPAGFYESGGCRPCPTGTKGPFINAEKCVTCPMNHYQPHVAQTSCKHCPQGYIQIETGKEYCDRHRRFLQTSGWNLTLAIDAYGKLGRIYNSSAQECNVPSSDNELCKCTICDNIEIFMATPNTCNDGLYKPETLIKMYGYVYALNASSQCDKQCASWTGQLIDNFGENDSSLGIDFEIVEAICELVGTITDVDTLIRSSSCKN